MQFFEIMKTSNSPTPLECNELYLIPGRTIFREDHPKNQKQPENDKHANEQSPT